ncbi:MAG: transcription elongation factor GreA [Acidimicrobiia bacterium]|nr:transcription elongation factor GreA [Acidimicrobiia bacterium]
MVDDQTVWLTPAAHRKLLEELEELSTNGRLQISERIAEARSHGDISENGDYDAAKNEQGLMEARIRKLRHILDTAEVRDAEVSDEITVGTLVRVRRGDGGEMEVFVATQENKMPGFVLASPSSPMGAALLGAKVGATVSYAAPGGTFELTVLSVRPFES